MREATVNGSQSQGLEGGERGREGFPQKRAGPRQTHDTVSDVTCHGAPQSKCRRQSRSGSDINSTQACHQNARRHVRHNCHANAGWMSPSATHATQKCMGARGMDSRGARGGETEAMDRRGQDHARYAKVTSKRATKERQMSPGAISAKDAVPSVPRLPRNSSVDVTSRLLQKGEWEPESGTRGG